MGAVIGSCVSLSMCECAACMACSCFTTVLNWTLSQATRFGHLLVLIATFVLAIIIGQSFPDEINGYTYYTQIDLTSGCDEANVTNCIYRQLIYRASFSLFILFLFLAVVSAASDYANRGFWILKFGAAIGIFIAFWWADNPFFSGWAELARVVSFGWLVIQGLLLIDFCHDAHDILMTSKNENGEDTTPYMSYVFLSLVGLALAILGLVFLFMDYTGCGLGMFFVILTVVMGVITLVASLTDAVAKGLLTPCLLFAYSVFMCWYALLSSPDDSCNPTADYTKNGAQVHFHFA
jgi:hypothetical protein